MSELHMHQELHRILKNLELFVLGTKHLMKKKSNWTTTAVGSNKDLYDSMNS